MDTLYTDYENFLIGNSKDVGKHNFYGAAPGGANQQRALSLLHYALEEVLEWDEEESIKKFDKYMIKALKLERVVDYIKYPAEVPDRDPRYILSLLYPDRIKLNYTQMVMEVFQRVLNGKGQFPREYFAGVDGFFRFSETTTFVTLPVIAGLSVERIISSFDNLLLSPDSWIAVT